MPEASSRVLLDRTTIRLDGRSFFTFGPRLALVSAENLAMVMNEVTRAGFTAVATPPASPGNIGLIHSIFDHAEHLGLLVVLIAEPRYPNPGVFLARHYKHRAALHSYCLPTVDGSAKWLEWFERERDSLRTQDLFHPIWTPWQPGYPMTDWILSNDIHSAACGMGGPLARTREEEGGHVIEEALYLSISEHYQGRPFFCHRLEAFPSDAARERGAFDSDPEVANAPDRAADWYPWLADIDQRPRLDRMLPDPELLRLRAFEMLAHRVRGMLVDNFEFLGGEAPFTGKDRLHELSVVAQEVALCREFFAEGQLVHAEVESGHPQLRVAVIQHSGDILLLAWRAGQGEEFWIDPMRFARVEISIAMETLVPVDAWQLDFPRARPLRVSRDARGTLRLQLDSIDLTAKVLLTRSKQRPRELADALHHHMPMATAARVSMMEERLEKIQYIEKELAQLGVGIRHDDELRECRSLITEARHFHDTRCYLEAWEILRDPTQAFRMMINRQMIAALGAVEVDPESLVNVLRHSYYLLPQFYREASHRDAQVIQEYT